MIRILGSLGVRSPRMALVVRRSRSPAPKCPPLKLRGTQAADERLSPSWEVSPQQRERVIEWSHPGMATSKMILATWFHQALPSPPVFRPFTGFNPHPFPLPSLRGLLRTCAGPTWDMSRWSFSQSSISMLCFKDGYFG